MNEGGNTVPRITKAEHIGPNDTGDNIEAKRVVGYNWSGSDWQRSAASLLSKPFDRIIITYTDSSKDTVDTIVTKLDGVTQQTLTNTPSSTVDDFMRT